jgi:hypothetical protein
MLNPPTIKTKKKREDKERGQNSEIIKKIKIKS